MARNKQLVVVWVALLGLVGCLAVPRPRPRPAGSDVPPNIILIVADDMGWNDVSFHGSDQIPTPNIDALAYNGVILNSHYVSAMCTPSRSALLTGKYPIHTGMQHLVILEAEPRGLPLHEKLLPQYLKEAGYSTAAIGKWHQGFFRREYTPTYRGFDSHFGYWNGLQDYYTHDVASSSKKEGFLGLDMRRNMSVARDTVGKYSTDLFSDEAVRIVDEHRALRPDAPLFLYMAHLAPHSGNDEAPLQAPDRDVARFSHVRDPERRIYAAMVSKLDESVGELVAALRRNDMLHNSVIVFMADNGAPTHGIHYNRGSNFPLRGIKGSAWEGAVRGAAAVWSPLISRPKRVVNELMYIADWFPTLLSIAGLRPPRDIDGVDQWPTISGGDPARGPSARSELLVNIDPVFNYSAIRRGDYKYVLGTVGNGELWYGETGRPQQQHVEGPSPTYDPDLVLMSQAGTAISGLLTANQVTEVRAVRNTGYERVNEEEISTATLLTADEILKLRSTATLHCTVPPSERVACDPLRAPCLFNIVEDPCEERNLAASLPHVLATLEEALLKHNVTAVAPSNVPTDPNANPALWNGTWVNWLDDQPREFLFERRGLEADDIAVSSDPIEPTPSLPGPILALTALLLGLALVAICALVALRCNARYNRLNRKHNNANYHNPKHFQEIQEPSDTKAVLEQTFQDENHTGNKVADKELPVINNHS